MTKLVKKNPFRQVTQQLPFYPDLQETEQKPVYCSYVNELDNLGDGKDPDKKRPVFIMADANTGEEFFIMQSYAIKKTVDAAKKEFEGNLNDVIFCFEFLGKEIVKGKPFNKFNGSYCTISEYEEFNKIQDEVIIPEKKKK